MKGMHEKMCTTILNKILAATAIITAILMASEYPNDLAWLQLISATVFALSVIILCRRYKDEDQR